MIDASHYDRRIRAARERLEAVGGDALVCFPSRNLQYLTGFYEEPGERHLLLFVPVDGEPVVFVPAMYDEQVREAIDVDDVRTWADEDDPRAALATVVEDLGLRTGDARVLVDETMHARFLLDLRAVLPDASFGLASEALGPLRRRKDDEELDAMRRSARVADQVVDELRGMGPSVVGRTERELAREIERLLVDAGGEDVSFGPIVASGPNGAKPHHGYGDRVIRSGDPVVLDFGTRVDGYVSDQTRTLVFDGRPSDAFREAHDVVRRAQQAGVEAVEPGATAGDVDRAAREVVEAAGYGEEFVHRTGHGVGLEVHEEPYVVAGSDLVLEEGMVFSVEPGVYVSGEFGVRIEDLVAVRADGCERLNRTDRGWGV